MSENVFQYFFHAYTVEEGLIFEDTSLITGQDRGIETHGDSQGKFESVGKRNDYLVTQPGARLLFKLPDCIELE